MGAKIRVVIGGIHGKMGRASASAILADSELDLVGAFDKGGVAYIGEEVANLVNCGGPVGQARHVDGDSGQLAGHLHTDILDNNEFQWVIAQAKPDVYLDFTCAEAAFEHGKQAIDHGISPVIGTSGLAESQQKELSKLAQAKKLGGIIVPNFSIGAVLMMEFARQAGALFSNVEIVEMHHNKKVDAPSGTAMHTVASLASTGSTFNCAEVHEREVLQGARGGQASCGLRVHSLRLPGLISHQEVIFGSEGELLTIRHDSYNTSCFMKGILIALKTITRLDHLVVGLDKLLLPKG